MFPSVGLRWLVVCLFGCLSVSPSVERRERNAKNEEEKGQARNAVLDENV